MGTHVEELGKKSNKKWQLTFEHSEVQLAITTLQCGYCKIMWLSLVSEIGRITRRHQCRHCATKMYGTGDIYLHTFLTSAVPLHRSDSAVHTKLLSLRVRDASTFWIKG
jgi:hypothetical protein